MKKVYIIHENEEWIIPLKRELDNLNTPYEDWHIDNFDLDINAKPPEGVFYNRMSASSHTRGHRYAPELTGAVLGWLESHGRKVVNGRRALNLELSKLEQYTALGREGIQYPKTLVASKESHLVEMAREFNQYPFIIKPNRGGKGSGVQLFYSIESLQSAIDSESIGQSIDGLWLIQEYVPPGDGYITRVEFVNGDFLYAVKVDASNGFELCPADSCQVGDEFCPTDGKSKFIIDRDYQNDELWKYKQFLKFNNIGIGALEYIESQNGEKIIYDVNTNTNYNEAAEQTAGLEVGGMKKIALELTKELRKLSSLTPFAEFAALEYS